MSCIATAIVVSEGRRHLAARPATRMFTTSIKADFCSTKMDRVVPPHGEKEGRVASMILNRRKATLTSVKQVVGKDEESDVQGVG